MTEFLDIPRHLIEIQVISSKGAIASQLRTALLTIGFDRVVLCSSLRDSIERFSEVQCHLIFFDLENISEGDFTPKDFVDQLHEISKEVALIAFFTEVSGERLFRLLRAGAQGFLLGPYTAGAIEGVFLQLQSGFDLHEEIRACETPQDAFSNLIIKELDYVAQKIAERDPSEEKNISEEERIKNFYKLISPLSQTVMTARLLCDANIQELYDQTYIKMYKAAEDADRVFNATRLRKTREMLKKQRRGRRAESE
jgi:hypothetical protein